MATSIHWTPRALAATALLGALVLAVPSQAQTSQNQPSTSAPTTQAAPGKAANAPKKAAVDHVEARITELHTKLKITPDQEPKWTGVAQVMRDNAKKMDGLLNERGQNLRTMTAVDDLRSYRDLTQAHVEGLQKLIPAFESLYDGMTPAQKKNADAVFAQSYARVSGKVAGGKVAKGS